jgi:hypothetical protein
MRPLNTTGFVGGIQMLTRNPSKVIKLRQIPNRAAPRMQIDTPRAQRRPRAALRGLGAKRSSCATIDSGAEIPGGCATMRPPDCKNDTTVGTSTTGKTTNSSPRARIKTSQVERRASMVPASSLCKVMSEIPARCASSAWVSRADRRAARSASDQRRLMTIIVPMIYNEASRFAGSRERAG